MALNIDAKFEGNLTCAFKNDMRNLADFHKSTLKDLKMWTFIQSRKCMSLKFTGKLCYDHEEWYKIWRELNLSVQNWHGELNDIWLQHSKISIICTLINELLWPKYIIFELRKYRGGMFNSTQGWYKVWRETDLCFQKWHGEFGKF